MPTAEEQEELKSIPANVFIGRMAVGGKMMVTEKAIRFRPHRFNLVTQDMAVAISDISTVSKCKTLGIVPNGTLVTLNSGQEIRFVVNKRSRLIELITRKIQKS